MQAGKKAHNNGFKVSFAYAQGPDLDFEKTGRYTESVVLRGKHADGRRFVAVWITKTSGERAKVPGVTTWGFEFAYCHTVVKRCNSTDLTAYLVTPHSKESA
jgi:hypothetical protein